MDMNDLPGEYGILSDDWNVRETATSKGMSVLIELYEARIIADSMSEEVGGFFFEMGHVWQLMCTNLGQSVLATMGPKADANVLWPLFDVVMGGGPRAHYSNAGVLGAETLEGISLFRIKAQSLTPKTLKQTDEVWIPGGFFRDEVNQNTEGWLKVFMALISDFAHRFAVQLQRQLTLLGRSLDILEGAYDLPVLKQS